MTECNARRCNGGPTGVWCGKPSTVVVTEAGGGAWPMQWFACDDPAHHGEGNKTEPVAEWFQARGLEVPQ